MKFSVLCLAGGMLFAGSACGRIGYTPGDPQSGRTDAGIGDAGGRDAGTRDAGTRDAGPALDSGSQPTLSVTLEGSGRVRSDPAGIDCPGACEATFDPGVSVVLTAFDNQPAPFIFQSWSLGCGGSDPECNVSTSDSDVRVTATFAAANYAFVSQPTAIAGTLGSLTAADRICQLEADGAGLGGTYVAWLSAGGTHAIDRLSAARGWVRLDGRAVADRHTDLSAEMMRYPILFDASSNALGISTQVITASNDDGTPAGTACQDLTDTAGTLRAGFASHVGKRWTGYTFESCDQPARIYCFGVDKTAEIPIRMPDERRRMFVSERRWTDLTGGVGSADSHCASEAARASLPGSYIAFLSTTTATAIGRVSGTGPAYTRMDGVLLAATAADFVAGNFLTSPSLDQFGLPPEYSTAVGSGHPAVTGSAALNCNNFTSSTATAGRGAPSSALNPFFAPGPGTVVCNSGANLSVYCVEQ